MKDRQRLRNMHKWILRQSRTEMERAAWRDFVHNAAQLDELSRRESEVPSETSSAQFDTKAVQMCRNVNHHEQEAHRFFH